MATPLAIVFLLSWAAPSWAAPCSVPAFTEDKGEPAELDESHPTCAQARAHLPAYEKLRDAAGIPAGELRYVVWTGGSGPNGMYWRRRVGYNDAYFATYAAGSGPALATMAHEVGHAVQHRMDILYPDQSGRSEEQKQMYSRQIEAHADSIGIELLLRAGYPPDVFVRGREQRFTCASIGEKDSGDPSWTHPADRHRWVNSLVVTPHVSAELAARHRLELEKLGTATPQQLDAAFFGTATRGNDPTAPVPALALPGPRRYVPTFQVGDFDERGRVLPGRLASSDLRLRPPPPGASVAAVEGHFFASIYADRLADYTRDLVNWWHTRDTMSDLAVRACGAATGNNIQGAVSYGVMDWSRDAAARTARWLQALVRSN